MLIEPEKSEKEKFPKRKFILKTIGIAFFAMSLVLFSVIFFPVLKLETIYQLHKENYHEIAKKMSTEKNNSANQIKPADENFSVVIPKIRINSKIISNVNTNNPREYQKKLSESVTHAKGSAHPNEEGDVFLFAHSGVDFNEALKFNAVFYLLNKIEIEDKIFVYYKKQKYDYSVLEKKIVSPQDLSYNNPSENPRLILMTCWPPGTTLKRMIIIAKKL